MRERFDPLLAAFCIAALCLFGPAHAADAPDMGDDALDSMIEVQQRAREDLNKKIKEYDDIAAKKARQSRTLLGDLSRLRRDAASSQTEMTVLEQENSRLQKSMSDLNTTIAMASSELSDLLAKLRLRIVDMYKYSSQEDLNLLLTAQDTHDALVTAYMIQCLTRQDQNIVESLNAKAENLQRSRAALETSRDQVRRKSEELERRRAEYDSTIKRTNALLKDIQSEQRKARDASAELSAAQQAIGSKIISLMNEKRTREQRARQRQQPAPQPPVQQPQPPQQPAQPLIQQQPAPTPPPPPQNDPPPVSAQPQYAYLPKGTPLEWPIKGPIAVAFGSRVHPVFKTKIFNSGIDIRAASGAPVKAAGPGEVIFNGWIRGFGHVVIIDHGGSLSTVYAHLASARVNEGDAVRTGTVVGTVGNSGTDVDYGLHFEVRSAGNAQNPINYLKKS